MKNSKNVIIAYTLSTFSALLTVPNTVKAQDNKEAELSYSLHVLELGLRFMPTISSFDMRSSNGNAVKGESVIGYGIGGMLAINFSKHIGVQAEVIYNTISQKFKDQELQRTITVDYVNVPLLVAFNTDKTMPVNLNLVIGPQLGINVGSNFKTSIGTEPDTLTGVLAVKNGDLGFAYGAGLDFCLNSSRTLRLDIGFRGVYGLIDISDDSQTITTNSYYLLDRTNIRTYSAYAGITFLF